MRSSAEYPNNLDRATFAGLALVAYINRTRHAEQERDLDEVSGLPKGSLDGGTETLYEVVGDILCDLRHWCDVAGIDFAAANERGIGHYLAEVDHEAKARAVAQRTGRGGPA